VETAFRLLEGEETLPRFIEVADVLEGAATYGSAEAGANYRAEFNDDWIGPTVVEDEVYMEAGFGR
jgi:hypothetical protein